MMLIVYQVAVANQDGQLFGGAEFFTELVEVVDVPTFDAAWLDFCKYYNANSTA